MERVREAMRFVANAREHVQLRRVRAQRDRVLHAAAIDAIGYAAGLELALLREPDNLDTVAAELDAEIGERGHGHAELALAAVDDEPIGPRPRRIVGAHLELAIQAARGHAVDERDHRRDRLAALNVRDVEAFDAARRARESEAL